MRVSLSRIDSGVSLVSFVFFSEYARMQCHIKENVSCENYGNAFYDCDKKISPKTLPQSHKKVHLKSYQNFKGAVDFCPLTTSEY